VIDLFDYEHRHLTVVDAIRYGTSNAQSPAAAAAEALTRLRSDEPPLGIPDEVDTMQLEAVIADAVERGAKSELTTDEAAHAALEGMRALGVLIGPRPPDDPFPEL